MNPLNPYKPFDFNKLDSALDQLGKIDLKNEKGIYYDESKNKVKAIHSKWGYVSSTWGADSEKNYTSETFNKIDNLLNEFINQSAELRSLEGTKKQEKNARILNSKLQSLKTKLQGVDDSSGSIKRLIDTSNRLAMMVEQASPEYPVSSETQVPFPPLPNTPPPPRPTSPPPPLPERPEEKK